MKLRLIAIITSGLIFSHFHSLESSMKDMKSKAALMKANKDLVEAARHHNLPGIDDALARGADINITTFVPSSGKKTPFDPNEIIFTPLMEAIDNSLQSDSEDELETVSYLLDKGADPRQVFLLENFKWTPLAFAVVRGNPKIVKRLLATEAHKDINKEISHKDRPLDRAIHAKNVPIIKLLVKHGALVSKKSLEAAQAASLEHDNPKTYKMLEQNVTG